MFKRTFKIVFRPIKSSFVVIPDNYYNVVSTYDTGCLSLHYDGHVHYVSWAPYTGTLKENEMGINARVAKEMGLNENDAVKCCLIADVMALQKVYVTPVTPKDWEIIELSTEKLSSSVLEQTRILNGSQILVLWINKSMLVTLTVDRLKPNVSYGRLDYTTQMVVAPNIYKSLENGIDENLNDTPVPPVNVNGRQKPSGKLLRSKTVVQVPNTNDNEQESFDKPTAVLARSNTLKSIAATKRLSRTESLTKSMWLERIERLKRDLRRENNTQLEFRAISGAWQENTQLSDVYIIKSHWNELMDANNVYSLRTPNKKEYYVKIRLIDDYSVHSNIKPPDALLYQSIVINANLMKMLELQELDKVILRSKPLVMNFVEKLELFAHKKTHYKIVENAFKRYVLLRTQNSAILLNQDEVLRIEQDLMVTVSIVPEHFRFCVLDAQFLKECKIYAADVVREVDNIVEINEKKNSELKLDKSNSDLIKLQNYDLVLTHILQSIKTNLCLDKSNTILRPVNVLVTGAAGSGKSVLVERVVQELAQGPYYCYNETFHCTRNKGRKVESIQKDLRTIFTNCLQHTPAIIVLENLDVIAHATGSDQLTSDMEYYNRIADTVHQLIVQYTFGNAVAVIATVNELHSLNRRIYATRGRHLFHIVTNLPRLNIEDRVIILRELCSHIDSEQLDLHKFAHLTEGYNKADLLEFIERAIFYAYRISKTEPRLQNALLSESLANTNSYCLRGVESANNVLAAVDQNDLDVEDVAGMKTVVDVLEELLKWPTEYATIFEQSPLRNQAGVLLFGAPGTGKTFLVSRLASSWNLRLISVKGPELLAKYIGQSEENVRNLFNRARSAKPCVLFFDEFDSLAPKRGHDSTGVTDRVVNQLLTEIDGVEGLQGVTIIAATSRPDLLDPALLRSGRIGRLIECTLPDEEARERIFGTLSATLNLDDCVDFSYFAQKSQNYTGADIQSILTSANMLAVKEAIAVYGVESMLDRKTDSLYLLLLATCAEYIMYK